MTTSTLLMPGALTDSGSQGAETKDVNPSIKQGEEPELPTEIIHEKLIDQDCVWRRFRHLVFFPNGEDCIVIYCNEITVTAAIEEKMIPNFRVLRGIDDSESQIILKGLFDEMVRSKRSMTIGTLINGQERCMQWSCEPT